MDLYAPLSPAPSTPRPFSRNCAHADAAIAAASTTITRRLVLLRSRGRSKVLAPCLGRSGPTKCRTTRSGRGEPTRPIRTKLASRPADEESFEPRAHRAAAFEPFSAHTYPLHRLLLS